MSAPQDEPQTGPSAATPTPAAPSEPGNTASSKRVLADSIDHSDPSAPPMSKNALKRLRKAQKWEETKDEHRALKRQKRKDRRHRQRDEKQALIASGADPSTVYKTRGPSTQVPVSLVLDCDFEEYMVDKERVSLSSQVTRSYSENRTARYRAHFSVAGWGGRLLERFEGPLAKQHEGWKGVGLCSGDFTQAALEAGVRMKEDGGEMIEPLKRSVEDGVPWERDAKDPFPLPDPEPEPSEEYKDIVYLTSDSPYTISRLEPNKSYIIGGLVDKNRHKGLCYRRARERGIRTARLPIGEYMAMSTRQVLATNHVVDIMLKWLEFEDWGKAFDAVIPKRKGGVLRSQIEADQEQDDGAEEDDYDDELEVDESAVKTEAGEAEKSQAETSSPGPETKVDGS